jgi:hypothetical protein
VWSALASLLLALAAPFSARAEVASPSWAEACASASLDAAACAELEEASDDRLAFVSALDALGVDAGQRIDLLRALASDQGFSAPPLPIASLDTSRAALRGVSPSAHSGAALAADRQVLAPAPQRPASAHRVDASVAVAAPAASGASPRAP